MPEVDAIFYTSRFFERGSGAVTVDTAGAVLTHDAEPATGDVVK